MSSNHHHSDSPNNLLASFQTRGPMKRHSLWHYFNFDDEKKRSLCKHCTYTVAGNYTTTLKTHLRNHHKPLYVEMEKKEDERIASMPVKRNASGNNLLDFTKKGKVTHMAQNLPTTSQPGGIVAYSIAGPDITAAFKINRQDSQEDEGIISNISDLIKQEPKEPQEDMPVLEEEIPSTSSKPPPLEKHYSYAEMFLGQTEDKNVNNREKSPEKIRRRESEGNFLDEEPHEDNFESFQIPDVTACLKKFHAKIVDLSKENKELKSTVGVLKKRVKTLEDQQKHALANENLTNGTMGLLNGGKGNEPSEFDTDDIQSINGLSDIAQTSTHTNGTHSFPTPVNNNLVGMKPFFGYIKKHQAYKLLITPHPSDPDKCYSWSKSRAPWMAGNVKKEGYACAECRIIDRKNGSQTVIPSLTIEADRCVVVDANNADHICNGISKDTVQETPSK